MLSRFIRVTLQTHAARDVVRSRHGARIRAVLGQGLDALSAEFLQGEVCDLRVGDCHVFSYAVMDCSFVSESCVVQMRTFLIGENGLFSGLLFANPIEISVKL